MKKALSWKYTKTTNFIVKNSMELCPPGSPAKVTKIIIERSVVSSPQLTDSNKIRR